MNVFCYMYYRLVCFYHKHNEQNSLFTAYCALCCIQSLTIVLIYGVVCVIFPRVSLVGTWLLSHKLWVLFVFCVLYIIQWKRMHNLYNSLRNKWDKESLKQKRKRKYILIAYVFFLCISVFLLPFLK